MAEITELNLKDKGKTELEIDREREKREKLKEEAKSLLSDLSRMENRFRDISSKAYGMIGDEGEESKLSEADIQTILDEMRKVRDAYEIVKKLVSEPE